MLLTLGRGISPATFSPALSTSKKLGFTAALPPEVTFTRGSIGTYRNNAGNYAVAASGQPRFNHNANGQAIGMMIEPSVTNKCENTNYNPTDLIGITANGDAGSTFELINDAAALNDAGLSEICSNGQVFRVDNRQAASNYVLYFDGAVGNTSTHSASLYLRNPNASATPPRTCRLSVGDETLNINAGTDYVRYKLEGQTPDGANRKLTLIIDPGEEAYFILNQLEDYDVATSIIPVNGASVTRAADDAYIDNIDQYDWFDGAQGFMTCRYNLSELPARDSYIGVLNSGASANSIGLRMDQTNKTLRAFIRASGSSEFISANQDEHIIGVTHTAGIRWNNADAAILSGGEAVEEPINSIPINVSRLNIGARNGGNSPIHGHIQAIEIGKDLIDTPALGRKLQQNDDFIIVGAGQSLMRGHFRSPQNNSNGGLLAHRTAIGRAVGGKTPVMIDGSSGGSAAVKSSNDTAYWLDLATNTRGPAFNTFYQNINDAYITPNLIIWAQGEEDSHHIGVETSKSDYKAGLEAIFADIHAQFGQIPIFIQRIGRRTSSANAGGVQAVRDIQQELIDQYDWCYEAAEIYDLGLYDHVHLDNEGYEVAAKRNALAVLKSRGIIQNGNFGPEISTVTRNNNILTVTLNHDSGTNFFPNTGIMGFKVFEGSIEISITNAVRSGNNEITITLASTPSGGALHVYYGYDDMPELLASGALDSLIKDDSEHAMPLRTDKIIIA